MLERLARVLGVSLAELLAAIAPGTEAPKPLKEGQGARFDLEAVDAEWAPHEQTPAVKAIA